MVSSILIVGFREFSSGKTSIARALIRWLREKGISACGFKPKAGNNLWYDYDIVHDALKEGRLYGKDAKLLKSASETNFPEEIINPIHRLWTFEPVEKKTFHEIPCFIVDRVTICNDKCFTHIIANDTAPLEPEEKSLLQKLFHNAEKVHHVSNLEELNSITRRYYNYAVEKAHEKIVKQHEAIVYESYSNNAMPWNGIKKLNLVLAVEPGSIHVYDADKYLSAVNLSKDFLKKEISVSDVCELLKPLKTLKTSPYTSDEIVDKLKEKMDEIMLRFLS